MKLILHYLPLFVYAVGMAAGQVLLKLCAQAVPPSGGVAQRLSGLLQQPLFYLGIASYAALMVLWIWILTVHPLSRAYPFVALSLALTPLAGVWLFDEPWSMRYALGLGLIIGGVLLVVTEHTGAFGQG